MRVNKHYLFGTRRKLNPVVIPHLELWMMFSKTEILEGHNYGTAQSHIVGYGKGKGSYLPVLIRIFCYYSFKMSEDKTFPKACDN